jgi:hypothetical protein
MQSTISAGRFVYTGQNANKLPVSVAAEPSCATGQPSVPVTDTSVANHPKCNDQSQPHITFAPQTPPIPASIAHNSSSDFFFCLFKKCYNHGDYLLQKKSLNIWPISLSSKSIINKNTLSSLYA